MGLPVTPLSSVATVWTRQRLLDLISERMRGVKFILVSNREPYVHSRKNGGIEVTQPASGLARALDPVMRACGGIWVAHGSGDADRQSSDLNGRLGVPPREPAYTLHRVFLDSQLQDEYYHGLSNEGLWPLCHIAFHRPRFSERNWESYREVNRIFADVVLEETRGEPAFVFIQDYHFGLLPRMLKTEAPNLTIAQFWHIPWPNRETFRAFPWKEELLDGMLGNDLLGFHLRYHCVNFLDCADRHVEAKIDHEHAEVTRGGRPTMVRPFPISIDFEWHDSSARGPLAESEINVWRGRIGETPEFLGIGIDRVDYTKGIPERLDAMDLLLEKYPEYRGRVAFLQIGVPSRMQIEDYRLLNERVERQTATINLKWGYRLIRFIRGEFSQIELMALHCLANFCLVTPLHDGMNLVAKEFVASRFDEQGVLILSSFAGAARELTDALLVNPFSLDEIACAVHRALSMCPAECRRRMQKMRAAVAENNIYRWAGKILPSLMRIDASEAEFPLEHEHGIAASYGFA